MVDVVVGAYVLCCCFLSKTRTKVVRSERGGSLKEWETGIMDFLEKCSIIK